MFIIKNIYTNEEYNDTVSQNSWEEALADFTMMNNFPEVFRSIGRTMLVDTNTPGKTVFGWAR